MTDDIDLTRVNKTIISILSKFPPIQNNSDYEYHRPGKAYYYGLKSSDFNKFDDFENGDRIFNHWRDKLVERKFLIKIYPNKPKGSPYAITPFGIAYLVNNKKIMDEIDILNCVNVVMHFFKGDKTGLKFDNLGEYIFAFGNSCDLFKFNKNNITIQTIIMPDTRLDVHVSRNTSNIKDKESFETAAYYLIGNMCWFIVSYTMFNMTNSFQNKKMKEYNQHEQNYDLIPIEVKKFGKVFGESVSDLLEAHSGHIKAILNFPNSREIIKK